MPCCAVLPLQTRAARDMPHAVCWAELPSSSSCLLRVLGRLRSRPEPRAELANMSCEMRKVLEGEMALRSEACRKLKVGSRARLTRMPVALAR